MEKENRNEFNEKLMLRDEVIDYNEVVLEEEMHQIQKPRNLRMNETVIILPSEHSPVSEVEVVNSENNDENSEKSGTTRLN
jgi:hypothetical protein